MPAPGAGRPLNENELSLLRDLAARKMPGPLVNSPARDRLRRLGLVESREEGWHDGARSWGVTPAGRAVLAQRVDA